MLIFLIWRKQPNVSLILEIGVIILTRPNPYQMRVLVDSCGYLIRSDPRSREKGRRARSTYTFFRLAEGSSRGLTSGTLRQGSPRLRRMPGVGGTGRRTRWWGSLSWRRKALSQPARRCACQKSWHPGGGGCLPSSIYDILPGDTNYI